MAKVKDLHLRLYGVLEEDVSVAFQVDIGFKVN
jgi:hypothetical protein